MTTYPIHLGCTLARAKAIGIDAIVNARAGRQDLNDLTQEDIELRRDAQRIKDKLQHRVRLYQVNSKFFRRHIGRIKHLMSDWAED